MYIRTHEGDGDSKGKGSRETRESGQEGHTGVSFPLEIVIFLFNLRQKFIKLGIVGAVFIMRQLPCQPSAQLETPGMSTAGPISSDSSADPMLLMAQIREYLTSASQRWLGFPYVGHWAESGARTGKGGRACNGKGIEVQ